MTLKWHAASVPLQVLCLGLFDAILTQLLSIVAGDTWQAVRRSLITCSQADSKSLAASSILRSSYSNADIICVQEASDGFATHAAAALPDHFVLLSESPGADGRRQQLSMILARCDALDPSTAVDLAGLVVARLPPNSLATGDLCAFAVRGLGGRSPRVLASLHGDSDGLCTVPVLTALCAVAAELYPDHKILIGIDASANLPSQSSPQLLSAIDYHPTAAVSDKSPQQARPRPPCLESVIAGLGLSSCWDDQLDKGSLWTVFQARTALQPQIHKAVGPSAARGRRHLQLKDWILFSCPGLSLRSVGRDNTGRSAFVERAHAPDVAKICEASTQHQCHRDWHPSESESCLRFADTSG
jgi:hypothetical protein